MTMVPAPKLSKPHLVFYRGYGGGASGDVMSRFGDGGSGGYGGYNNINGNASTTADNINTRVTASVNGANINKLDNTNGSCCVLGSDLGVGHHPDIDINTNYSYHNIGLMAEEEQSRTSNTIVNDDGGEQQQPAASATPASFTSIKRREDTPTPLPPYQDHHHHRGTMVESSSSWLQLGLGGTHIRSPSQQQQQHHPSQVAQMGEGSSELMLELNLGGGASGGSGMIPQTTSMLIPELESRIPHRPLDLTSSTSLFGVGGGGGGGSISGVPATFINPHHPFIPLLPSLSQQSQTYLHHPQHILSLSDHYLHQQQQQIGWGYINQRTANLSSSPSSSSSIPIQGGAASFLTRPFATSGSSVDAVDSEFRLIHPPPRRPHSGIWFALQASNHQLKELCLPQVPKSFLRIKDGRMTIRLVMKYVANKLGLDNESEVEIRCRGQQLVPYLTLQHVRDNIWSPREAVSVTLLPESSTSDHVMVLNYGRSTISSSYLPTST